MRVLLADAQALVREGLKSVSLQIDGSCQFVEAGDAVTARRAMRSESPPDVAWIDETLLEADELVALRCERPALIIVALATRETGIAMRLRAARIDARVPKSAPVEVLGAVLRLALAGNAYVRGNLPTSAGVVLPGPLRGTGPLNLTSRQYEVLGLIAQSRSNKAIATELGIGVRTVKGHVSVILRALHADNRADAGRSARRWLARSAPSGRARDGSS
ncbi:MAG: response regulator transcription factor [Burkholderiales bacterium]